jgi:hypothetical protein
MASCRLIKFEGLKVLPDSFRNSSKDNRRITMVTHVQAVSHEKREAQSRMVRLLAPGPGKKLV